MNHVTNRFFKKEEHRGQKNKKNHGEWRHWEENWRHFHEEFFLGILPAFCFLGKKFFFLQWK